MKKYEKKKLDLETLIPVHKMGFKILRENQLKNMFPTYENLFERIDTHRSWVKKLKAIDRESMDYQYNLMYDTVFSIFGSRGSGKTSAVFTLKNMIEQRYQSQGDIVLPIIMPEMIPDNCDIISWILAIIEQIVTQLEETLQRQTEEKRKLDIDNEYFCNCRFKKNNKLRLEYNQVKELYFSKEYSLRHSESFYAAIGDSEMQIQNGYKFSKAFTNFWTTLKEAIEKIQGNADEIEPLVYLIFDDVDLAPNKVVEMLAAIVKHLSHPNLIVIVTADEELFNEVVENSLRKKLGYDDNQIKSPFMLSKYFYSDYDEFVLNEAMEKKRRLSKTARLYLDKILPPSSRYYINTFDTCLKRRSFIERIEKQNNIDKVIDIESLLQIEINAFIIERTGKETDIYENFLYYRGDAKKFINAYLLLWGDTSRQLANQCFLVEELISNLNKIHRYYIKHMPDESELEENIWRQMQREMYQQIHHYLYNTINSNGNIDLDTEEISHIVNNLWYLEHDQWPLYINYHYLNEYYHRKILEMEMSISENWSKITRFIFGLYTLLFFVENILLIWDNEKDRLTINKGRNRIHGKKDLVNFFDSLAKEGVSLVRNSESEGVERLLFLYGWMMEKPEIVRNFDITDYSSVKNYFYMLQTEEICTPDLLKYWSKNNPIWFSNMVQAVHLAYSGIYLLGKNDIHRIVLDDRLEAYDSFVQNEKQRFKRMVINYFINVYDNSISTLKQEIDEFKLLASRLDDYVQIKLKLVNDAKETITLSYISNEMEKILQQQLGLTAKETNKCFMAFLIKNYLEIIPDEAKWEEDNVYGMLDATIEKLKMELQTIHAEFYYYFVKNVTAFKESLGKIKAYIDPYYMDIINSWENKEDEKLDDIPIEKEDLDKILSLDAVKKMRRLDEESQDNLGKSASEARIQMMGSLELSIHDRVDLAIKYVVLWKSLFFFMPYYITALIKQKESAQLSESFDDLKFINNASSESRRTFSYSFYQAVHSLLNQKGEDSRARMGMSLGYVKSLLRSYIELAGKRYYQHIMENSDE